MLFDDKTRDGKNTRKEQILITALKMACDNDPAKVSRLLMQSEEHLIEKSIIADRRGYWR